LTILLDSGSEHIDTLPHGRIIKDVMKRQSGEAEKAKKRQIRGSSSADSPRARNPRADVLTDTSIDPADFFDPEEFGYRRKQNLSGE
jgi:hypothetical protein